MSQEGHEGYMGGIRKVEGAADLINQQHCGVMLVEAFAQVIFYISKFNCY